MDSRNWGFVPMLALLVIGGGILPSSTSAQTVLGPEYTLSKLDVSSLQKDERQCEYFLWTKLGGDAQRISFNYVLPDGKTDGDAPRVENVKIVIDPAKIVPTARITGMEDARQTKWQLTMAQGVYEINQRCLAGIPTSEGGGGH